MILKELIVHQIIVFAYMRY